jgi:hypothetical protein
VAPAGFNVHVPKGTLAAVETAFAVVPRNKRDSWRLHRVSEGDTFAGLAKRYSAQTASISQVNHQALPEAGGLMAIPVGYPGDRTTGARTAPARKPAVKGVGAKRRPAPAVASALRQKKTAPKTAAKAAPKTAQRSASKAPVRHTASLRTPSS